MSKYEFGREGYLQSQSDLFICTNCESDTVYAKEIQKGTSSDWLVTLYCQNCRILEEQIEATEYQLVKFDEFQDKATKYILSDLVEIKDLVTWPN